MNTNEVIEAYEYFLTKFKSEKYKWVDDDLEKQLRGLPEELIYIWKKYGLCSYGNGIWWHTNPRDFDDIVELWLKGTPYWEPEINRYHVIGRTAFGVLELWGEKTGNNISINPLMGMIFPRPSDKDDIYNGHKSHLVGVFLASGDKEDFDTNDQNSKHIFDRALKKLGSLKWNEMYAPVPLPMLSGGITIENVEKVEMFTQLSLLREFIDEPEIMLNPMMGYD